jgi:probable rRNA maturation factor
MLENFSITNETKGKIQRLPIVLYKNKILGKKYDLSLVFVGEKKIKELNKKYRKINKPTDILSFPISKVSGEIFVCQKIAKIKAKEFGRKYNNFISFLLIHGMVHLLGFEHGKKMEKLEEKWRKFFKI